jgi:Predicted metal-dependent phosphoesterases (PHP family)
MANSRIDLHIHSTASDGSFTPRQLIEMAKKKSALDAVALTDHDTVAGVAEFQEAGREFNIETFTGVEVSADFTGRTMHILGYGVDIQEFSLLRRLESIQEGRSVRNIRIIERLQSLGISITIDDVKREAGTTCSQVGRPHIASVLLKKGVVVNIRDAFDRYLRRGAPAYMERKRFSPEECIDMISQSGGVAVLAHPKVLQFSHQAELESTLRRLCAAGLGGIEVYYTSHRPSEVKFYEQIADKFGLIRTGGSDFHGASKTSVMIGSGNGSLNVPGSLLPPLRAAIAAAKSDLLS